MAITKVTRNLLSTGIDDQSNATAITIDSSENVGIGTASPAHPLDVVGAVRTSSGYYVDGNTGGGYLWVSDNEPLRFGTNNAERVRIDESGNVGIGQTAPTQQLVVTDATNYHGILINGNNAPNISFDRGTAQTPEWKVGVSGNVGDNFAISSGTANADKLTIASNGSVGAPNGTNIYNASDERLKQNISTLSNSLDVINALNPVQFNWINNFEKNENGKTLYGFIAQEVQETFPDAVESFGNGDNVEVDDKVIENPLTVRDKFLIPVLVKAMQEQQIIIESLKARITTLEG